MFRTILFPVDMAHLDKLSKSLQVAADLAKHYGAPVNYVAVTSGAPSSLAHTPQEFQGKLEAFAKAQADAHGHTAVGKSYVSHDPSVDLDATLLKAIDDLGADLVVMAAYVPSIADHLRSSHESVIARRSHVSVFVVR